MNKDIEQAITNLRSKLMKEDCKLALHGYSLIIVYQKEHCWDNTYISVDIGLQETAYFDMPVY